MIKVSLVTRVLPRWNDSADKRHAESYRGCTLLRRSSIPSSVKGPVASAAGIIVAVLPDSQLPGHCASFSALSTAVIDVQTVF